MVEFSFKVAGTAPGLWEATIDLEICGVQVDQLLQLSFTPSFEELLTAIMQYLSS